MIKSETYRNIFRDQSTKSLSKFKLDGTNKFVPALKIKEESNAYTITSNPANYFSNKEDSKKQETLQKRVKILEAELKRKVLDDNILKNLFKTKNSSEFSHIDIYLQFKKIEQFMKNHVESQAELKDKICQLQNSLQKQEDLHIQHIQILGSQIQMKESQWKSEKHQLQESNKAISEDCQNYKFLLEQVKKKYGELNKKYKEACDQLEIQKSAKILEELKEKQEYQNRQNKSLLEVQTLKQEITKLRTELEYQLQKNDEYKQQIEQLNDQKQKLQLRIKEIQQVSNDFNIRNKQEKEKYHQNNEKMKLDYESKYEEIIIKHQQQLKLIESQRNQMNHRIVQLENQSNFLKAKLDENKNIMQKLQDENIQRRERQISNQKQFENLQKKVVKLSIQLMQVRFEKDEQVKKFEKQRYLLEEKQNIIRNLQSKRLTQNKNSSDFKTEIQKKYFRS